MSSTEAENIPVWTPVCSSNACVHHLVLEAVEQNAAEEVAVAAGSDPGTDSPQPSATIIDSTHTEGRLTPALLASALIALDRDVITTDEARTVPALPSGTSSTTTVPRVLA
jgi:hypothetical protein